MSTTAVDFLVIGAHPDDAEICAGGMILHLQSLGYSTAIVDLTCGEMGTRGDGPTRQKECQDAAKILGCKGRDTLDMGDCRLAVNEENKLIVTDMIRKYAPKIVVAPDKYDRHPDHAAAGLLAEQAFFLARVGKLKTKHPLASPRLIMHYPMHNYSQPLSFIADITPYWDQKMAAIKAHHSQFVAPHQAPENYRPIGAQDPLASITSRYQMYGHMLRVDYGEGFLLPGPVRVDNPFSLLGPARG